MKRAVLILILLFTTVMNVYTGFDVYVPQGISIQPTAGIATTGELYTIITNPGGVAYLPLLSNFFIYSSFTTLYPGLDDGTSITEGYFLLGKRLPYLGLGFGYTQLNTGVYQEKILLFTVSREFGSKLAFGITGKYLSRGFIVNEYTLTDPTFTLNLQSGGISFDLGLIYTLNSWIKLGLVAKNFNQPDIHILKRDIIPVTLSTGLVLNYSPVKVYFDGEYVNNAIKTLRVHSGLKYTLFTEILTLAIGTGVGNNGYARVSAGLTCGLGIGKFVRVDFNYTLEYLVFSTDLHQATGLSFRF